VHIRTTRFQVPGSRFKVRPETARIAIVHRNPSDQDIKRLLSTATTVAIVGASSNPERPSNGIMRKLKSAGYRVIPVNPNETEVLGERAYPTLADVPDRIDIVDVFRRAEFTPPIADDAVKVGAKALWLQSGVTNEDAAARATAGGLTVVMDACIGVMHSMLQIGRR
jgi:predicted CoA-binding protein